MENQISTLDFIASFGKEGPSILTFTGPIIIVAILVAGIFLWRKRLSKTMSVSKLAQEIDQGSPNHGHTLPKADDTQEDGVSDSQDKPSHVKQFDPKSGESAQATEPAIVNKIDAYSSQNDSLTPSVRRRLDHNTSENALKNKDDLPPRAPTEHEKLEAYNRRQSLESGDQKPAQLKTSDPLESDANKAVSKLKLQAESELASSPTSSWLERLRRGLSKTRTQLSSSLSGLFYSKPKLDDELLEKIHEAMYKADMGVQIADLLVASLKSDLPRGEIFELEHISNLLKQKISEIFLRSEKPQNLPESGPKVILIVGVNGVGKTTTVGKLAAWHVKENSSVLLCAADTFRAAAIEQLSIWADRVGVPIVAHKQGADPAAVAFDGVKAGKARGIDTVIIDTAGRLHNKAELMAELGKVTKVIQKEIPTAPHETWIVVDATTGQNAIQQVKAFGEVTPLTGVIVTKLDGTAKGGIVAAISHQFGLPIRYIGVGEDAEDLRPFNPQEFVASLF